MKDVLDVLAVIPFVLALVGFIIIGLLGILSLGGIGFIFAGFIAWMVWGGIYISRSAS